MSADGLDDLLSEGRRIRGAFPEGLEARFLAENAAARVRQFRLWILISIPFNLVMMAVDLLGMPQMWRAVVVLKLGLVNAVTCLSLHVLRTPSPRWSTSVAAVATHVTGLLATLLLFAVSDDFELHRSLLVLPFGIMLAHMMIPIGPLEALLFTLLTLAAGDLINWVGAVTHRTVTTPWDLILFSHAMALVSISARLMAERETRRSFASGLHAQRQTDELARANARLLTISSTDGLTGLKNRRAFDRAFAETCSSAAASGQAVGVMMIDVDHFKKFNDTAGHLEGDRCLVGIAQAIQRAVPGEAAVAARFGGEEFVVMVAGSDHGSMRQIGERVRVSVESLAIAHPGLAAHKCVSVSIGVACSRLSDCGPSAPDLLRAADAALYVAKSEGRNRVSEAVPQLRDPIAANCPQIEFGR